MSSIGKIASSLASVTNENTLALLNVKFDFSVFRCEPIAEFLPVGSALTQRRKDEAESGQTHKTARILGYLFNDIIPDTPELRKAYGNRVSDILSRPDINPQGTEDDGPFCPFIGADCTSIWAAATSGDAAIGVLLLACMLAGAFEAKEAVSIWSQLVEERKQKIQSQADSGKLMNPNTMLAAQQDITRSQLSIWDASARSWIRRADVSMRQQKTQFTLIVENLTIPYPRGETLLEGVTTTWSRAMEVMENLLNNNPQQACDRAIVSGISSWHLYPDLVVFQDDVTNVSFHDPLLPSSGVLSLNLEYKGTLSANFIQWSLALSHLRYYGDPVKVRSNETLRRIQISQLWLPTLGAILCNWQTPYTSIESCMAWFAELGKKLRWRSAAQATELSWLLQLCSSVTGLDADGKNIAVKLIKYGYRRATRLLGDPGKIGAQTPFFGLCNPATLSALAQENKVEVGIEFLRQIACKLGLEAHEAAILYDGQANGKDYAEWAAIKPLEPHLARWTSQPSLADGVGKRYARWISYAPNRDGQSDNTGIQQRQEHIQARGEFCQIAQVKALHDGTDVYHWVNPPAIFGDQEFVEFQRLDGRNVGSRDYDFWITKSKYQTRTKPWGELINSAIEETMPVEQGIPLLEKLSPERIVDYLLTYLFNPQPVGQPSSKKRKYEASASKTSRESKTSKTGRVSVGCYDLMTNHIPRSTRFIVSLRALEVANRLYAGLSGVTVSLGVIETDILEASWLPDSLRDILSEDDRGSASQSFLKAVYTPTEDHFQAMTRKQSFACVAKFESGHADIDPDHLGEVIALCYEDSIFVSDILVSDPGIEASKLGLRHMVGNVGHAGMVLMVSPREPRIRPLDRDAGVVEHHPYDSQVTDSLKGTSLHLSFTTWKMPLDWETTGEIDQQIFLLESVVSVQHRGKWVADIDVLGRERESPDVVTFNCDCEPHRQPDWLEAVSLDNWEELLDLPPCIGILRANGNWVARLAATSILIQQGQGHVAAIIDSSRICWSCLRESYMEPEPHLPQVIIY